MTIVGFIITRDALLLGHFICETVRTNRCLFQKQHMIFSTKELPHTSLTTC
jgi:hypothetical protein